MIAEKNYVLLSLIYHAEFQLSCGSSAVSPSGPVSVTCNAANGDVSTVSCDYDNGDIVEDCKSTRSSKQWSSIDNVNCL